LHFAEREYLGRKPMYEKSSAEASVSLIMPRRSIFNEVKDTNKPQQRIVFLPSRNAFDEDVLKRMLIRKMPLCRFWAVPRAARAAASPGGGPQNPAVAGRAPQAAVRTHTNRSNAESAKERNVSDEYNYLSGCRILVEADDAH
jgi:hypothetical protein